ncbi:MAG: hypothetical protein A2Y12_09735 [Planctomycetes bacterium GWF2_42_9]|nr:MAG: hypothetical protein A2Y12_09735 [Planctomycetes bacterium GWF2_42_9]
MTKASATNLIGNAAILKQINKVRLLSRLRMEEVSRAELARLTGLDAKTITNLCNSLFQDGLLLTEDAKIKGRGRPAENLVLNPDAAFAVGVDIGAVQVSAVLIDLKGAVCGRWREEFGSPQDKEFLLKKVDSAIHSMINVLSPKRRKKLKGVGVCVPGFINRYTGNVINSVNICGFRDVPLVEMLRKQFDKEIILEESSRSMALAEIWFGNRQNCENFMCMDLGFGIGIGIIHNGLVYRGANECSGEIGHTVVDPDGKKCRCGKKGCLETVSGGKALQDIAERLAVATDGKCQSGKALYEAAVMGNRAAARELAKAGHYIGIAIANVINLFDPGLVILNGGLVKAGEFIVEPVKSAIRDHSIGSFGRKCEFEISNLGDWAGAMGAAMLPLRNYFEFENVRLVKDVGK